ncbi:MAG: phosphotransferase [Pseudomonadota bacterium]
MTMTLQPKTARADELAAFVAGTDWRDADIRPLAGDASNRRYLRLAGKAGPAVLMDAPPDKGEDVRPFIAVTEWLRAQCLSAPQIFAQDADRGFLILEDLGDALFAAHLRNKPQDEQQLYGRAIETLAQIAQAGAPRSLGQARQPLASYDAAVLRREAALFIEWWMPAATGTPLSADLQAAYTELVDAAVAPFADARDVVVLRDYHAENLLWLPERGGTAAVGLLDYQDALAGHPAYDLMSLLEDARRPTSDALQRAMIERYLSLSPSVDGDEFRHAYAALGAARNLKIVGIFARLALRDGKPRYLDLIPHVWTHVQRDLTHPALAALSAWVARHAPDPDAAALARVAAKVPS